MKIKYLAIFIALLILTLFISINSGYAAHRGEIIELTPIGEPYNEEGPIQFRCVLKNVGDKKLPSAGSNYLVLTILDPDNNVVKTVNDYNVPRLDPNETYTYVWDTTNTDFPVKGYYTIRAEWYYPSGSDTKSTSFYSIPSPWFIVAIAGFLMAIAAIARKRRWWLTFYAAGAVAIVSFIISFLLLTGYDTYIMGIEALNIAYIASFLGLPSTFLPPNAFIFPDPTGWSIFGIGFECSSIIEISVLAGLLLLYPGYSFSRKVKYASIGIGITYVANLIRMLSIVYIVNIFGKTSLYFAHAIVGKLIFFAFVVVLYWYLLTRPTMGIVRDKIKSGKFEY
ncbi:MAG: hypothetical protein ACP5C3_04455 [Methanomicrobiales archaeon]